MRDPKILPSKVVPFTFYVSDRNYHSDNNYDPETGRFTLPKPKVQWKGEINLLDNFNLTDNPAHQLFFLQIDCTKFNDGKQNNDYCFRLRKQDLSLMARPDIRSIGRAINRFLESGDGEKVKEVALIDFINYSDGELISRYIDIRFLKATNVDMRLAYAQKAVAASFIIHLNPHLGLDKKLGFEVLPTGIKKEEKSGLKVKTPDCKDQEIKALKELRKNIKFFDKLTTKAEYFGGEKAFRRLLKKFTKDDRNYFDISSVNALLPQAVYELYRSIDSGMNDLHRLDTFDGQVELDPEHRGIDAYRLWTIYQWIWCIRFLVEDYLQGKKHGIKTFREKVSDKMPITAYALAAISSKLCELEGNNESVHRKTESKS